ncbi:MAG: hypothetical protein LBR81_04815 [Prevotellaceae bacterium]|nr:hypothetical protein [Prevotellaceae bacterium]
MLKKRFGIIYFPLVVRHCEEERRSNLVMSFLWIASYLAMTRKQDQCVIARRYDEAISL